MKGIIEMKTRKTIATISYNTPEWLEFKLWELVDSHDISDYFFINHKPEEDEKKDHIHLWICPNKTLDTMDLQKYLTEFDPEKPDKPRKCINFVVSKVDDAILYFKHDPRYLAMKGETRKYHYLKEDFHYLDEDNFDELYNHAYRSSDFALKNAQIEGIMDNKDNLSKLIETGLVPLGMASNLCAYSNLRYNDALNQKHTFRNNRKGHD